MLKSNAILAEKSYKLWWFKTPLEWQLALFAIMPIVLAQLSQRLFPVIDNHYLSQLGNQALLIHNIQYSFIYLGQYIGGATATSCLIFWKRSEYVNKQKYLSLVHLGFCFSIATLSAIAAYYFTSPILSHFSVDPEYMSVAKTYFHIGLVNMVLQACYLALAGMLIATGQEKLGLMISLVLMLLNIFGDSIAIHMFFSGMISPQNIFNAMLVIGLSTTLFLFILNCVTAHRVLRKADNWGIPNVKEVLRIWGNELGNALISGIYPIIYAFQLGAIKSSSSLLVTYQLALQFATLFCIPLMATMQISLRDAVNEDTDISHPTSATWWKKLLYLGLIPTQLLLVIGMIFPNQFLKLLYGYTTPNDHAGFVTLFFLASIIGQIGNAITVPIRARKKSHYLTLSYFISDVVFMLGGMQLIIFLGIGTPIATGVVTLVFATAYFLLNLYFCVGRR